MLPAGDSGVGWGGVTGIWAPGLGVWGSGGLGVWEGVSRQ